MTKSEDALPSYEFPGGVNFLSPWSAGDYLPLSCAGLVGLFVEQKQQNQHDSKMRKAKYVPGVKPG